MRYFSEDAAVMPEARRRFCRCALHVMVRGVPKQRAYRTCAATTRTSTGGKPCMYDFGRIPEDEVRQYARAAGLPHDGPARDVRRALTTWYHQKAAG